MVTSIIPAGTMAPPVPGNNLPQGETSAIIRVSMDTVQGFEALQRVAKLFMSSSLVPKRYQGQENLPNTVIALNLAFRMGADPLQVMQHLNVVYGVPTFDAQFLIASVNSSGKYTPLRYEWQGARGSDDWGCRAWAYELVHGVPGKERLYGAWVTIGMAKAEGWFDRKDKNTGAFCSKWRTIPEQMLMYRSASYWVRTRAPEVSMGMRDQEEVEDMYGGQIISAQSTPVPVLPNSLQSPQLQASADPAPPVATSSETMVPPPVVIPTGEAAFHSSGPGPDAQPVTAPVSAGPEDLLGPAAGQAEFALSSSASDSPAAGGPLPDQWELLERAMESAGTIREVKKLSVQLARAPAEIKDRLRASYERAVARFSQ